MRRERSVVEESAEMTAPPHRVYGVIADYRNGHPRIIPSPPFDGLVVESGGVGAGTRIRFGMRVLGRLRTSHAVVAEPEPGRMLTETIEAEDMVTSFIVDPSGTGSRATIRTDFPHAGGIVGRLQAWLIGRTLRPIYRRELALLDQVSREATRVGLVVLLLGAAGCSVGGGSGTWRVNARPAQDIPEAFVPADRSLLVTPGDTIAGDGCRSPLEDPRDQTQLSMIRSAEGFADYEVPSGRYGTREGEVLRLDCNTGRVAGIVPR